MRVNAKYKLSKYRWSSRGCLGSNFGAERSPLLGIDIGFAIGAITIGAGGGTGAGVDVVAVAGSGAEVFAGSDGELSGGGGDGDRELGVITDGDGDKWDVVGEFQIGRASCRERVWR